MRSAMARPAASSFALLTRRPEDRRCMVVLSDDWDVLRLRWALSETRLVLRSEEHTSELQSPCNLVCRLLLEKKINMLDLRERSNLVCRLLLEKKSINFFDYIKRSLVSYRLYLLNDIVVLIHRTALYTTNIT